MENFTGVAFGEQNLIPEEFLTEIGRIIIEWSAFDRDLDIRIHGLWQAAYPKKPKPTLGAALEQRRKMWSRLVAKLSSDRALIAEAKAVSSEAAHVIIARNHIAHGIWLPILAPGTFEAASYRLFWMKAKEAPEGDVLPKSLADLKALTARIKRLRDSFFEVSDRVMPNGYRVSYT